MHILMTVGKSQEVIILKESADTPQEVGWKILPLKGGIELLQYKVIEYLSVKCLQANCASSEALDKLLIVSLISSLVCVLYHICHIFTSLSGSLTLGLMCQIGFSIIQLQKQHDVSFYIHHS